jgi:hypothetical protein
MRNCIALNLLLVLGGGLLMSGCGTYHATSGVPAELRTIAVPVFENKTGYPEFGAIATQHTLREIQRQGSFKIAPMESASLKLLCSVHSENRGLSFNRTYGTRASENRFRLIASVTLVERGTGKFLLDNVPIEASTTFMTYDDLLTGMQNAAPRVAEELSRNILDTILALWMPKKEEKPVPATEVKTPEAQVPETKAPEVKAPDAPAPEVKAPETKAAEVKAPETKVQEVKTPEMKIPEGGLLIQLPQETEDQLKPRKYR